MLNSEAMCAQLVFEYENNLKQFINVLNRSIKYMSKKVSQGSVSSTDFYDKKEFLRVLINNAKCSMEMNEFSTIKVSKRYKSEMRELVNSIDKLVEGILTSSLEYDVSTLVSIRNEFSQLIYVEAYEEEIPELVIEKRANNYFNNSNIFG